MAVAMATKIIFSDNEKNAHFLVYLGWNLSKFLHIWYNDKIYMYDISDHNIWFGTQNLVAMATIIFSKLRYFGILTA